MGFFQKIREFIIKREKVKVNRRKKEGLEGFGKKKKEGLKKWHKKGKRRNFPADVYFENLKNAFGYVIIGKIKKRDGYGKIFDGYAYSFHLFPRRKEYAARDVGNGAKNGGRVLRGERAF